MANHSSTQRVMMRPQYHFRKVGDDTHIWRVEPLLKRKFTPFDMMLSKISEIYEPYWYHDMAPTCISVMEHAAQVLRADLAYPILICEDHKIIDGMHRVMKAHSEGKTTIRAHQIDLPAPDYKNMHPDDLPY
ncbi:MAG: disulfide oxidoreductase YuzD [Yoonia sp.]|jgi:disulfide oxidoreductase YuzD